MTNVMSTGTFLSFSLFLPLCICRWLPGMLGVDITRQRMVGLCFESLAKEWEIISMLVHVVINSQCLSYDEMNGIFQYQQIDH